MIVVEQGQMQVYYLSIFDDPGKDRSFCERMYASCMSVIKRTKASASLSSCHGQYACDELGPALLEFIFDLRLGAD